MVQEEMTFSMDINQQDKQTYFHITYGFSPRHYVEVKHTKVTSNDLEKIAKIIVITEFADNEQFKSKSAGEILEEVSNEHQLLIAVDADASEKFNLYDLTTKQQEEILEILSTYPETFKVSSPNQIFLG